ncbi:cellular tumor antigen p53-like [Palaemon carinicauda]|uniref:cellular tumor antigen p53-like n=1 Tax=Palaemon carinicauda TaxID=392227 RepID=UPI0035B5A326
MVKKLKIDDGDQGQQQPFQQEQQQRQQLHQQQLQQQQQQQTVQTQGLQVNFDDNLNTIQGAIGDNITHNDLVQTLLILTNDQNTLQQSSSSSSMIQQQPFISAYQQQPTHTHSTQNTSTSVPHSRATVSLSSANLSEVKPAQYGVLPHLHHPSPNAIHNGNFYSQDKPQRALQASQSNILPNHCDQPSTSTSNLAISYNNPPVNSAQYNMSLQSRGSIALYKPPEGGAPSSIREGMFSSRQHNEWAVPKSYTENGGSLKNDKGSTDIDELIQGNGREPSSGPPVAQFPQRNSFSGIYGLQVSFPGESPKLVVKEDAVGNRYLFTELDHCITTVVKHSADQSAAMRFIIVFSRDCEATQPVHPCKNHQKAEHPNHMLEVVSGSSMPIWEEYPHPSIVVAPSPSSEGNYSVQLKFLCRNSCITRKNLTLICQLEREGTVVGRKCLELKISACPRRDAKTTKSKEVPENDTIDGVMQPELAGLGDMATSNYALAKNPSFFQTAAQSITQSNDEVFSSALESGRAAAYSAYMEKRFKEMHPQDYASAKADFECWWDSTTNAT